MQAPVGPYRKTRDEKYSYRGNFSDGGVCRLRIFEGEAMPPVVVLTELAENENTSVTNMVEYLAAEVISKFLPWRWEFDPPAVVLENYPPLSAPGRPRRSPGQPEYDVVTFKSWRPKAVWQAGVQRIALGAPEWKYLPLPEVAALIGEEAVNG
jgi:hypothetical protein